MNKVQKKMNKVQKKMNKVQKKMKRYPKVVILFLFQITLNVKTSNMTSIT
jgi:hypothetical protein